MTATVRAFVAATLVALAALLIAAATDRRATAFSIDISNNQPVASLAGGQSLCQSGIPARAPFDAVQLWALPARALEVTVTTPAGRQLRRRISLASPPGDGQITVALGSTVASGGTLSVCVRNLGRRSVAFEGGLGEISSLSGNLSVNGRAQPSTIALVFLRAHAPSLLSLLPTVFDRAALFKLSWVGPWTFWLLLAALLAAFGVIGWALVQALREE